MGTPKRQRLWSNDPEFLRGLAACAQTMRPGDRQKFQGEALTKRHRRSDGTYSWSGKGDVLKASQ